MAQINLVLVYGQESKLPVCYCKLPGNISDVTTVKKLLFDLEFLSLNKVKLVMDRGFFSETDISALYEHHYKFLIAVKTSLKLVQKVLNQVREAMLVREHYSSKHKLNYYSTMITWPYKEIKKRSGEVILSEKRVYLHLFHNDQRAVDDKAALNALLDQLEALILCKGCSMSLMLLNVLSTQGTNPISGK